MKWIGSLNFKTWYGASYWPFIAWVVVLVFSLFYPSWLLFFPFVGGVIFNAVYSHFKYQQYEKGCDRHRELIVEHRPLNRLEW